jgi:outer membrane protein assembly factor BamB
VVAAGLPAVGCAGDGGPPPTSEAADATEDTIVDPYAAGWSAVHADPGNTDYAPVDGAADLTLAWHRSFEGDIRIGALEWTINLGPTVSPDGRVYLTSTTPDCHLQAIDADSGDTVWCAPELDYLAVVSSPVLDRQGRAFVADSDAMHAFDPDGEQLWESPIVGVPLSAQFTPAGRLVFVTHVGVVYVLDRETGEPVMDPVELVPDPDWDASSGMWACARGTEGCPSANTPAVDLDRGRLFFTFWEPGAPQAGVRAMQIEEGATTSVVPLWSNDDIPGGTASSPDLSADGTRIYVTDNVGNAHAIDSATGETIWTFPIGVSSGGSASLSPDGVIMPAGGPLQAVRDDGTAGSQLWREPSIQNRGIATQVAGGLAYATVGAEGARNDLVVVDTATGEILDRETIPGATVFSVGITVGADGTVYVPMIVGDLLAFRPA